jgi:hypothetical protein
MSITFNAVIFEIVDTAECDKREYMYDRKLLNDNNIILPPTINIKTNKQVWIYVLKNLGNPNNKQLTTANYPIVQSYVDIFLKGCLQHGEAYAEECIRTTVNWPTEDGSWIDDREHPRRPLMYEPKAKVIDILLKSYVPNSFNLRTFEKPTKVPPQRKLLRSELE